MYKIETENISSWHFHGYVLENFWNTCKILNGSLYIFMKKSSAISRRYFSNTAQNIGQAILYKFLYNLCCCIRVCKKWCVQFQEQIQDLLHLYIIYTGLVGFALKFCKMIVTHGFQWKRLTDVSNPCLQCSTDALFPLRYPVENYGVEFQRTFPYVGGTVLWLPIV